MVAPVYWPLPLTQAADNRITREWLGSDRQPKNLTGYSAWLTVREAAADTGAPALLSLSTASGTIVLGTTDGTVELIIDQAAAAALNLGTDNRAWYQFWVQEPSAGLKYPVWEGPVILRRSWL